MAIQSQGKLQLIEVVGNLCRRLGLPRTVGQIYGLLFLSPKPLSLEEIADSLGISKASASTGTRHLASLGALRKVWVPGDRKDHFEAVPDIATLVLNAYREIVKPRLDAAEGRMERVVEALQADRERGVLTSEEFDFCQNRLQSLGKMQNNLRALVPLIEKLF